MAERWTVVLPKGTGVADVGYAILKEELDKLRDSNIKAELDNSAQKIIKGIKYTILKKIAFEATRDVLLTGVNKEMDDLLNQEGWMNAGVMDNADSGKIGKFFERDVFNMTPNSDPRMDLTSMFKSRGGKEIGVGAELKTMLNVQGKIPIGTVSVWKEIVDNIEGEIAQKQYKNDLILYKMLLKMQNFVLASTYMKEGGTGGGQAHVTFRDITLYSGLIVEYVEQILSQFFNPSQTDNIGQKSFDLFSIEETVREDSKPDKVGIIKKGLISYDLKLKWNEFKKESVNFNTREVTGAYEQMYRHKTVLMNTPDGRRKFFAIARRIAKLAGIKL